MPDLIDSVTVALLRELVAEVRGLRQVLEQQHRPSRLTRADQESLGAILPAIAGALGSELFTARELLEQPAPALRLVLGGFNPRQLGRLLSRAEGAVIDGLLAQRDGLEVGATLWRIVAAGSLSFPWAETSATSVPLPAIAPTGGEVMT